MRFLVYSDLHLHTWSYGSKLIDGKNSRLKAQQDVLRQIKEYALSNNISKIICCGDVFHTQGKVDAEVLQAAYHSFNDIKKAGLEQIWMVGNHDQKDKRGIIHALDILRPLGEVVDTQLYIGMGADIPLVFFPYTEDEEYLKTMFKVSNIPNQIMFIHQGVSSVPMKNGYLIDEIFKPEMILESTKHVFSGHYHNHTRVTDKLTIPGAPMQHTWGDEGEKRGWLDVEVGDEVKITHVESDHPKFIRDVEAQCRECDFRPASLDPGREVESRINLSVADFDMLDDLICDFAKEKNLDRHTEQIGRQLREGKYEAPKAGSG